ncbi:MAG: hypothetical protein IRZ11_08185, partial [Clostridia bacterium]|nr:hypothetical protein [Clostridia bacterium]
FIALYAYLSFPATVANVAWTSLMAELFPPILRGRVFADRNLWLTLASLLASLASGVIVALIGWPWHYAVLTLVTLAGQLLSIRYLAALREEPLESPPSQGGDAAPAAASDRPAGGRAAGALGWRPFWTFAAGAFVFQFGLAWPQGIWPTVFIDIDGVPVVWFGIWNTVSAFATIASVRAWGRAHDRRGPFFVAAQAALLFGLLVPFYLWVTTGPGIALLNAVGGVATAAINLALFNGLLAAAPAEARPHAVGWFNLLIGLANFAGPLLGAWQFHALGLAPTIAVAAVLRVAGAAVLVSLAPRAAWALPSLPSASAWRFALGPFVRRALGRRAENVR